MIVPAMSLEEKLAHAREDLVRVQRKYLKQLERMEHDIRSSRDKTPRVFHDEYRSPLKNHWFVTMRVTKKHERMFAAVWWQFPETGLEAMTVTPEGSCFYFDTHFFQRYRERETKETGALDNMRRFFFTNYDITMKMLDTERHGLKEAVGIAREGLFVGTVRPGGIVACDTFLSEEMLRKDQKELHLELQHHAHARNLSGVQLQQMRQWAGDVLKILGDEDAG